MIAATPTMMMHLKRLLLKPSQRRLVLQLSLPKPKAPHLKVTQTTAMTPMIATTLMTVKMKVLLRQRRVLVPLPLRNPAPKAHLKVKVDQMIAATPILAMMMELTVAAKVAAAAAVAVTAKMIHPLILMMKMPVPKAKLKPKVLRNLLRPSSKSLSAKVLVLLSPS